MFFREIIGQERIIKRLIQTTAGNRVSHAWLFFGPEGSGALPLALAFAQYILCTDRGENDSCGQCASCRKNSKYMHPDVHFVFPVNKTKDKDKDVVISDDFLTEWRDFLIHNPYGRLTQWYNAVDLENKQGLISTEESRKLTLKLSLKSYESEYKIVLVWYPEKMNDQAANKLLKILEEPPSMTIFLMVSENPDQLLATIRSRCTSLKVPYPSINSLTHNLSAVNGTESRIAEEVARLCGGNYLKAQELIQNSQEGNYHLDRFRLWMRSCYKRDYAELIRQVDELAEMNRENQKAFLEYGLRIIREGLVLRFEQPDMVYITESEKTFTPNFATVINGSNVAELTEEINRAIYDIERNGSGRIVFLDLALRISVLIRN